MKVSTQYRNLAIRHKLRIVVMSTVAAALLLAGASVLTYDQITARESMRDDLGIVADIFTANSTAALSFGDSAAAKELLSTLKAKQHVAAAFLYTGEGNLFAAYRRLDQSARPAPSAPGEDGSKFEADRFILFRTVRLNGQKIGTVYLASDLGELSSRLRRFSTMLLVVMLGVSLFAGALSWRLQRTILDPIAHLGQVARIVSVQKNYAARALKQSDDDLGKLTDTFNEMLSEIESRDHALSGHRDSLELEVAARTAANVELVEAKDRAESASRIKSEFLANMSHEIRTPMNGVMGMTELVLETDLTEQQRDYLSTVKTSADALLMVINDILDFSKIEAGKLELEEVSFNVRDHMEEIARALAMRAHEKGLELISHVRADVPEYLSGDMLRIRQILINLLGNAIKFTESGEVELEAWVEASDAHQMLLHFVVKDTGIGIPKEKQSLIFEAFSQVDGSTTRRYGGTGLGLSISACLAAALQGKIWVESTLGEGSQFHFTASLRRSIQQPADKINDRELAGLSVVVVDDNPTNRRILVDTVAAWGMQATPAAGASEALEHLRSAAARKQRFDLVLTDLHMPDMDGFGLAEQIHGAPELTESVVLMLTSGEYGDDLTRCKELGVSAYLVKPIRRAELRLAIVKAVSEGSGRPWEQPQVAPVRQAVVEQRESGCRILVAEDNVVNQRVVRAILEKAGHIVWLAGNGAQAIELMQKQTFDVVLMDIQMPEMDGVEATAAIRKMEIQTGAHMPIIALTAHAMTGDRERLISAGMDDYISKPIAPVALLDLVALHFHAGVSV